MASFVQRHLVIPLKNALKAGLTPNQLSKTIVAGIAIGAFPILGTSSFICLLFAYYFQLNQPVIQSINLIMTPIAISTALPFIRFGQYFFGVESLDISPSSLLSMLRNSPTTFLIASLCGIFAWAFFTIPISFILYPVIRIVIVKYFKKSLGAAGRRSVGSGGGGGGDVDSGDEDNATDLTELTSLTSSNSRKEMENTLRQKGLSDQTMEDRAAQNRLLMQKMIDSTKQEKPAWDVDWPEPKK